MSDDPNFTFQTRLHIDNTSLSILEQCAEILSVVEHKLFSEIASGKKSTEVKNRYLKQYHITARQFNSCRVNIEGKIASIKSLQPMLIANLKESIKLTEQRIKKNANRLNKRFLVHQKKRRLDCLKHKLDRLSRDVESGIVRMCFGSKKLFRAQFHLEKNGYKSHKEWKKDWGSAREGQFFLLGSKDETAGNQTCTAKVLADGSLTFRLRLPHALEAQYGKYLEIPGVYFKYGHANIIASLSDCEERKRLLKCKDKRYSEHGQAISYRFQRDNKGFRVFATTSFKPPPLITRKRYGAIGVDINADRLAVMELDRFGNGTNQKTYPLLTYGKTRNQIKAEIGNACAAIVQWAQEVKKPIVIEKLDFQKKKNELKDKSTGKHARMLSSLAYNTITVYMQSRGLRYGVEVVKVNPAYTSLIGRTKFVERYGLSIHHAAALCIARRYLGFSEQPPKSLDRIHDGKGGHVALSLPVRNRGKHVWSFWRRLHKKFQAVLAAHFRTKHNRSSDPPRPALETFSEIVGEIPTRESLVTLFG
jgi:IS605 OrfB family transposase